MNVAHISSLLLVSLLLGLGVPTVQAQSPAPKKPDGYLPVEDVPKREDPAMSPADRAKLVNELRGVRDRQTSHLKANDAAKNGTKPAKP